MVAEITHLSPGRSIIDVIRVDDSPSSSSSPSSFPQDDWPLRGFLHHSTVISSGEGSESHDPPVSTWSRDRQRTLSEGTNLLDATPPPPPSPGDLVVELPLLPRHNQNFMSHLFYFRVRGSVSSSLTSPCQIELLCLRAAC